MRWFVTERSGSCGKKNSVRGWIGTFTLGMFVDTSKYFAHDNLKKIASKKKEPRHNKVINGSKFISFYDVSMYIRDICCINPEHLIPKQNNIYKNSSL